MTNEEIEKIMDSLQTSLDFLSFYQSALDEMDKEEKTLFEIIYASYSAGYISCIEFNETKTLTRPFKFKSYKEQKND